MTAKLYTEVDQNTISQLKLQGFTNVQLVLLDEGNPYQATIELIPGKHEGFGVDIISLHSSEINDYIDGYSPMAKYVIDQDHLTKS